MNKITIEIEEYKERVKEVYPNMDDNTIMEYIKEALTTEKHIHEFVVSFVCMKELKKKQIKEGVNRYGEPWAETK